MTKNILVSAGVAIAVVALGLALLGRPSEKTVVERVVERLGAAAGPDMLFDYLNLNGVTLHPRRVSSLVTATNTPATVRAPVNATSTLLLGSGCHFTIASSGVAMIAQFGKSVDQNSTTTNLFGSASIAASAAVSVVATTSDGDFVFEPGYYLNVGLTGGNGQVGAGAVPTGECNFLFLEL